MRISYKIEQIEILDLGWFTEAELPADTDPGHVSRIPYALAVWRGEKRPYFDA